ncbi:MULTISPECIES: regulatory protein RecX [unclassified Moraxella]|uniref:regulatory protein RecX n=1 Tax=unclassified Moraxella TaxID=2685852 RepID=UPI00359EC503
MTTIKTLAEILADIDDTMPAKTSALSSSPNIQSQKNTDKSDRLIKSACTTNQPKSLSNTKNNPSNKQTHFTNPKPDQTKQKYHITTIIANDTQQILDDATRHALQGVDIEPIYQNDKTTNHLRWLAFYYLSKREHSRAELRQKLLDKWHDSQQIDALLDEFSEKGYQSDERFAFMLIRESVRRGRGKNHILHTLKKAKLTLPYSLDELIQMADIPSINDGTVLVDDDKIDWLRLAVEARCKKYGNDRPISAKDKAKQLRFLQYRGFEMGVCFDALKYTLDDLEELRFR